MFGFLYALFMGIGCTIDSIRKDSENDEAKRKSMENGGQYATGIGKRFYNGREIIKYTPGAPEGHDLIIDKKTKQIIKDFTQEKYNSDEEKDEKRFIECIENAKKENKLVVLYDPFFFSNGDFRLNHPKGYYEVSTCKRVNTMTDEDGNHFKLYDKIEDRSSGYLKSLWFIPDKDNKIQITENEWIRMNGNKIDYIHDGEMTFFDYAYVGTSYVKSEKRGK